MRVGVFLPAAGFPGRGQGEVLAAAVDAAVTAERAGFDDVWIAEHHFMSYGLCPSATTLAAYVLGRTERVAVGTAVSVLSTTHPVALAEQAALLDQVSGGRFRLGVGRGGPWVDLEVFGTGLERYETGFEESLDLLVAALGGGPVSASGETFQFREVEIVPRPSAPMRPVVACTSPGTVGLAAARGLPMLLGMHIGDADKAALVDAYARTALRHGHDPAATPHMAAGVAHVADSTPEAVAAVKRSLPTWLEPGLAGYRRADARPHRPRDAHEYTDLLCRLHPIGSPAHCAETLRTTIARTGVRHLVLLPDTTGDPAATRENITRLGAEVLPLVRRVP
ncbi:LLM class flavin-dependent oxidoreductase [Sphaerisporangium sp. TRM90804]|uniref:LLM class flavin-dependent oxidoreductase n=1 Tax=Sphaerisporangium sp. TRM90804 TaxID=3031113 RepID=UPI00244BDDA4|nr:LLM class flavin-dependent oxidoreductase [Sphaerisporangium sp. TRM90804]MDH2429039.1 LLM class flavin-dependent oxidoreductase [Sphaerisporangium sp. TRM90804]